ncbi:MAG: msrA [Caulobacter sp.]|nr:msrA [Caulobacter sp.]
MRFLKPSILTSLAVALSLAASACAPGPASAAALPAPAVDAPRGGPTQVAVFSGGCFWGVQGVFQHVKGVKSAVSGYAGGAADTADYETVSGGSTGHAESVRVVFDPAQISYGQLLQIFFSVATDPTQLNAQYPDQGTQYRNEIFYTNPDQKRVAQAYIAQLDKAHAFKSRIVTRVDPLVGFYNAEAYHQDYLTLHPESSYISSYDLPKIANLRKSFPQFYRASPVLVGAKH